MKLKGLIFLGLGVAAVSIAFGFLNMFSLQQTSAEEFARDFQSRTVAIDNHDADMSGTYDFDKAHSFIGFGVKHMGLIEVPGYFRDFAGKVIYDAKDMSKSSVDFTAKVTSVDTGVAGRDNHLRTADFFEVEKFPELTFKSTKVEKKGEQMMVSGDLTIKGVTKQVSFPFTISGFAEQRGGVKMGITAQTTVNRRDFGINWGTNMPNGIAVVSDDIKINLQIEAARLKVEAPAADK